MKTSVGSTVSMNIVFTFIVIIFAFVMAALSYYKAYKVNNIIADSIEKYEGYNYLSEEEINKSLTSLGYNQSRVNCDTIKVDISPGTSGSKHIVKASNEDNSNGYCIYYNVLKCVKKDSGIVYTNNYSADGSRICKAESYNFIVKTYINFNIPVINQLIRFPVYTKTNEIYSCYGNSC